MRLNEKVESQIIPSLAKEHGLSVMALPSLQKITINCGVGRVKESKEALAQIEHDLAQITGQHPKWTAAKKSISTFKLREGQKVGYVATLRGKRMWDFLERLVNIVFPRMREFDGLDEKILDANNNLTIGFREQIAFPEIKQDEVKELFGFSVTLTIKNAENSELVRKYLKEIGLIFK